MGARMGTEKPEPDHPAVPETADALLVLDRMNEGFYAIDREWKFLFVNRSAEAFWGLNSRDLLGRSMLDLFPRFAGSPAQAAHREAMESNVPGRVETISTATGAPVELRLFPATDGLSVYFHDITARRRMEQELAAREELLTLAELSAGIGVWVADLEAGTVTATPQFFRLLGLAPITGPFSPDVPRSVRHPADRERNTRNFQEALAAGADTYESEYRIRRPSGEERWIFGRGRIARDAEGRPWRYSGVDIDITERKRQEEHLRVVMKELVHRNSNLLAIIKGIAQQTASRSADLADFMARFEARLQGLAESTALLAREDWRGAPLDELIRTQAKPFGAASRLQLEGPPVLLSPRATQNLGLAIHELCTNALKYGALSAPGGRVEVGWTAGEALTIRWKERGGPPVTAPTRAGFGRIVAEQMLAAALGASVGTRFDADGIEWVLSLPAAEFSLA